MLQLLALFKALCFSLEEFKARSHDWELARAGLLRGCCLVFQDLWRARLANYIS